MPMDTAGFTERALVARPPFQPRSGLRVPAQRSRTENWRDCLKQIHERGGALELSIDRGPSTGAGEQAASDLVWRCRIVDVGPTWIAVEPPAAFGATLGLRPGARLIGGMTIGQNRWMFRTVTLPGVPGANPMRVGPSARLVVEMPVSVERCSRRSQFRVSTAHLNLPRAQCWPLIDPTSVCAAEAANRALINDLLSGKPQGGGGTADDPDAILLPEVGPMFNGALLNISGGGMGLLVGPTDAAALASRPLIWLRVDLRPEIPAPIAITARVAHTHIDSAQQVYAGLAFDFAHNPGHRAFVVEAIGRYLELLQRGQSARAA